MPRKNEPAAAMPWVNAPRQARSQRTLEKLLDAAERILLARGLDAVTVPEVVREAGSSVGSFYARFPDKRALLETVHERACVRTLERADELLDPARWVDVPLDHIVSAGVRVAVEIYGSRRNIMNAFAQAFAGDPGFAARRARSAKDIRDRLARLVLSKRDAIAHPDPERAIDMSLRAITATLEQRNAFSVSGMPEVEIDDVVLVEELTRMVRAYLAAPP
jgi:AcrR family transcriptional regulator